MYSYYYVNLNRWLMLSLQRCKLCIPWNRKHALPTCCLLSECRPFSQTSSSSNSTKGHKKRHGPSQTTFHGNHKCSTVLQVEFSCNRTINVGIRDIHSFTLLLKPLNSELNPICYLLALLGAHHFLHASRIRVKLLTLRLLMSYIYGAQILDVSRSHTTTQHSR